MKRYRVKKKTNYLVHSKPAHWLSVCLFCLGLDYPMGEVMESKEYQG